MTGIQVRGTTDPGAIAVVVALLSRGDAAADLAATGVTAWQQVRRSALSHRSPRRPRPAAR